jgi:DNA/RNA-binding domain of Phe-tRNA-synthetase-like protein
MRSLNFKITQEVTNIGVKGIMLRIIDIKNLKNSPEFDKYLENELKNIRQQWYEKDYKTDLILQGFRTLHEKVKRSNRKYPASPEELLRIFIETGRFPRINLLVDIYNLVSLKTRLALGAHDIDKVIGNITLRLTNGTENFHALGSKGLIVVPAGEYSYIDDGNNIICRMEVLQVEPTKITVNTTDVFLIVQGNSNTDQTYIKAGVDEVLNLINKYCGGSSSTLLNSSSP